MGMAVNSAAGAAEAKKNAEPEAAPVHRQAHFRRQAADDGASLIRGSGQRQVAGGRPRAPSATSPRWPTTSAATCRRRSTCRSASSTLPGAAPPPRRGPAGRCSTPTRHKGKHPRQGKPLQRHDRPAASLTPSRASSGIRASPTPAGPSSTARCSRTMIQNWRDDWKQGDFPFLFVQLAPYRPKRQGAARLRLGAAARGAAAKPRARSRTPRWPSSPTSATRRTSTPSRRSRSATGWRWPRCPRLRQEDRVQRAGLRQDERRRQQGGAELQAPSAGVWKPRTAR